MKKKRGKRFDRDREIKRLEEVKSKKLLAQKQKHLENIEEEIKDYKKYQQELKSKLTQLIIKIKRDMSEGIQKEKLNENKNMLEGEIKMVSLIIETYEIRSKVKKLDIEHKELVTKEQEGEFVSDLLKSNRYEVALLNKQDKENSDIIKELLKEQNEKKIKLMEEVIPRTPAEKLKKVNDIREIEQLLKKFGDKNSIRLELLEEMMKNEEEYKVLLVRKSDGEPVEDLIKKNRNYSEILAKRDKKASEESRKWRKSKEAAKVFEVLEETRRLNWIQDPVYARENQIRFERGLKIADEITKNDEEFEKLIERKNKGEFVDDLIRQNRYTAKVLDEHFDMSDRMSDREQEEKIMEQASLIEKLKEKEKKWREDDVTKFITKFMELIERERNILDELMKYDEEYKVLLERKNAGESIEDLIKQNRFQAEILAKKDKENIEEIYDITCKIGYELKKNEEEYERLLERRNKGEYVDDFINQNRNSRKVLVEQNKKVFDELYSQGLDLELEDFRIVEIPKREHAMSQLRNMTNKFDKYLKDWVKNEMEYDNLLKREKGGKSVRELIKKNRTYAEDLRIDYMKNRGEAKEWLRMNPEMTKEPWEKNLVVTTFRLWPRMEKSQKCPNCRIMMNYLEYFDGYQCPRCKKKFYLWEKKFRIVGNI